MRPRPGALAVLLLLSGCAAGGEAGRSEALRQPSETLVVVRTLARPPLGGDGPTTLEIAWRGPSGALRPVGLERPATALLAWGSATAVVDDRRTLWLAQPGTTPERIGDDASGELATSPDGSALAWVAEREVLGEVRVRTAAGAERTIARQLQSAGALRFAPDGTAVLFRGARLGGVAGLFVADVASDRVQCLSNCTLRTGRPWPVALVAGPGSAQELAFDGDSVTWSTPDGQRVVRRWRAGAP